MEWLIETIAPKRILPVHSQKLSWLRSAGPRSWFELNEALRFASTEPSRSASLEDQPVLVARAASLRGNESSRAPGMMVLEQSCRILCVGSLATIAEPSVRYGHAR